MILVPECLICTQRIALEAARFVTKDETVLKRILFQMMDVLRSLSSKEIDSFLIGLKMMEIIREATGSRDPYKHFREACARIAQRLIPAVRDTVERSNDPLWEACRSAVIGNLLDVVSHNSPDSIDLNMFGEIPFAVNHFQQFRSALKEASRVVYLADNAGEVFFDRILIEAMRAERKGIQVHYFIKDFPFLSDALPEDIAPALMDQVATIRTIALVEPIELNQAYLDQLLGDFLEAARQADLVVVKGQANFELLMPLQLGAFFLFTHKCPVIARAEQANIGEAAICRR
jgi:hypothetical protein